jgi:predicted TIM-barrel fold metal-dependent hydrolase
MLIDAHVHFGIPEEGPQVHTPLTNPTDVQLKSMEVAGVDACVIMPMMMMTDYDYLANAVKEYPDKFIPVPLVDPWHFKDIKGAVRHFIEDMGMCGIKLRPTGQRFNIDDYYFLGPLYEICSELEVPLTIHTGDDVANTPLQCQDIATRYPKLTLVMAHAGWRTLTWQAIEAAKNCPNIILDQTAGHSLQLKRALEVLGPERIIFGSDAPYMDVRVEIVKVKTAVHDARAQKLILGENVKKIWRRSTIWDK